VFRLVCPRQGRCRLPPGTRIDKRERDTHLLTELRLGREQCQTQPVTHMGDWLRYQCYGLVGWQLTHKPEQGYARALGALDSVVVQQWSTLPQPAQEALSATYSRLGLTPPGSRR
jgi:hypothetical protein